jgi:hypothetical protein
MSVPILDSAATMDVTGASLAIHYHLMKQSILSHPAMTLAYRGDDGITDGSDSDADSIPGLVNDSDEKDDDEEADMVYDPAVQLPTSPVMTYTIQDSLSNDIEFDKEAMCKFMTELCVAETDMIEPEYIKECPLCGLFRYLDDPKHIDI